MSRSHGRLTRITHSAYCDVWRIRDYELAERRAFVVEITRKNGSGVTA
jgi:hypothetical protein